MFIRVLYEYICIIYDFVKGIKIAGVRLLYILNMIIYYYLNQKLMQEMISVSKEDLRDLPGPALNPSARLTPPSPRSRDIW
jgi:hypothetical protein